MGRARPGALVRRHQEAAGPSLRSGERRQATAGPRPSRSASSFPPSAAASSPGCSRASTISTRRAARSTCIVEVEPDKPNNRLNDGVVDPAGRLWFGTMDNGEKAKTGAFYCFADGQADAHGLDDIAITNGPAVSPDGRMLYFVDTLEGHDRGRRHPRRRHARRAAAVRRGSTRRTAIPTGRRSTAKAASGSRSTRAGRRAAIRPPAS